MRKKSTKLLALLTAGITAASLLAGCGSGGSDNAGTTDQAQESETKTEDTASTDGGSSEDAADTTEDTAADTTAEAVSYPLAEGGELILESAGLEDYIQIPPGKQVVERNCVEGIESFL